VTPSVFLEQLGDAFEIMRPHGDIDIAVCARQRSDLEIDGPTAEQPIREPIGVEHAIESRDCRKLWTRAIEIGSRHGSSL
jgi:hypothetical protein